MEDDFSDVLDNELGAVVEFEDDLDEAQTEADVKNISNKHQMTIEELKREVLGSVKKKRLLCKALTEPTCRYTKVENLGPFSTPLIQVFRVIALTYDK